MKKNDDGNIPGHFHWALNIIGPKPSGNILEVGCGSGILASMIAGQLRTGQLAAIDQSTAMIRNATEQNRSLIANGKAAAIHSSPETWQSPATFNKIIAFNVRVFWKSRCCIYRSSNSY